jgi:hypothetical protein
MTNTYDMLLNPPPSKQKKPEEKKVDSRLQTNQWARQPVSKKPGKPTSLPVAVPQVDNDKKVKSKNTPINLSVNSPVNQSANQLSDRLMDKSTGFYISETLDRRLDAAVEYFRRKHNLKKVDRSIVLNALLEDEQIWRDPSLNQLIDRLIRLLTRRLMG